MKMDEILNQISNTKYHNLIKEKIKFLENEFKEPIKVTLIKNNYASKIEDVLNGGKVVWKKPETEFPKTPISIKIDALNLIEIDFLAVFLHECGHVSDYNNPNIQIKSKKSEISAWKHAIKDFNSINFSKEDRHKFIEFLGNSLTTYDINKKKIEEITNLINPN